MTRPGCAEQHEMTIAELNNTTLGDCVDAAREQRVVITRDGKPVAVLFGIEGLDEEQQALCADAEFWRMITEKRNRPTISRQELE